MLELVTVTCRSRVKVPKTVLTLRRAPLLWTKLTRVAQWVPTINLRKNLLINLILKSLIPLPENEVPKSRQGWLSTLTMEWVKALLTGIQVSLQ